MGKTENTDPGKEPTEHLSVEELTPDGLIGALTDANKNLRRKIFDLFTIFEISRHLNSMLDVQSLLDAILFTCIGQMGVSGASIIVVDPETGEMSKFNSKGMVLPKDMDATISRLGPLSRFLQRNTKSHKKTDILPEMPEGSGDWKLLSSMDIELVVPLVAKGNLLGVLFMPGKLSGDDFHDDDLEFVSILVNQLSVALYNASLYENEKKALNELKETQRKLIETERLAALGTLSASIAHEVNNPLAIIKNYLAIIEKLSDEKTAIKSHVSVVHEEVNRIAGIVRQLLDFYRPSLDEKKEIDICEILKSTIKLIEGKIADSGINIIQHLDDPKCRLVGSPDKLKQVFLNILLNARDAMPDGGNLFICQRRLDGHVELEFADTGKGIDDKDLPHIFEPFYTAGKESGTGLGLSVCYGIIRSHEGSITAKHNNYGGATFLIKLPLKVKNAAE
ncbi:MAG: GAF domain-containing protein [Candidatus Zixiibacteriota bacterium]|nr:MAG: GAF domain-containing protein [candidate division Zixibacteria bacterium]